jgi:hypothetical protein
VRRVHPVPRRDRYLADPGYAVWYTPKGGPMTVSQWQSGRKAVAVYVDGTLAPDLDAHGPPLLDDDVLILVNGPPRPVTFTVPEVGQAMLLAHRTGQLRPRRRHHQARYGRRQRQDRRPRHGPHGNAGRPG